MNMHLRGTVDVNLLVSATVAARDVICMQARAHREYVPD
jgi:hypothetical protein